MCHLEFFRGNRSPNKLLICDLQIFHIFQSSSQEVLINVCDQVIERSSKILAQRSKQLASKLITTKELKDLGKLVDILVTIQLNKFTFVTCKTAKKKFTASQIYRTVFFIIFALFGLVTNVNVSLNVYHRLQKHYQWLENLAQVSTIWAKSHNIETTFFQITLGF